jgi:multicomponent Na+:H+ antiporter subunit B
MKTKILKLASSVLKYIFIMVSVWLLLRGHNQPGGGFIGGLIAGSALIFKPLAFEIESLKDKSNKQAVVYLIIGLTSILVSGIWGGFTEGFFLDGVWKEIPGIFTEKTIKLGTPLLFDIGIYFTVIGFLFLIVTSMMEEWSWK